MTSTWIIIVAGYGTAIFGLSLALGSAADGLARWGNAWSRRRTGRLTSRSA